MSNVNNELRADLFFLFSFFFFLGRMDRKCKNNPDRFSYICSNVVFPNRLAKITNFAKKVYCDYLGIRISHLLSMFAVKHVWRT